MNTIDQLKADSKCFGKAYDANIKECKLCHCIEECKSLTLGITIKPKSPLANKVSKELSNKTRGDNVGSTIQYPDFKKMTMEELGKLAVERNADPSWQRYDNQGIRRMRLTMAIKKTYTAEGE